jgi:hypothetical protein
MRPLKRLNYNAGMPENRIHRVTVKRTADSIWAEAEITLSGVAPKIITSSVRGIAADADPAHLKTVEDAQLSEVRKRLYDLGFSKRAIASAIKSAVRVEERGD